MSDKPFAASPQSQTLYDTDFALWIDHTAQLLKERRFNELDLENLIEEIESLVRSEQRLDTDSKAEDLQLTDLRRLRCHDR